MAGECWSEINLKRHCFTIYEKLINLCAADALGWLGNFRRQMEQLKHTEHELKENLKIFGVVLPDSAELAKVEKVICLV